MGRISLYDPFAFVLGAAWLQLGFWIPTLRYLAYLIHPALLKFTLLLPPIPCVHGGRRKPVRVEVEWSGRVVGRVVALQCMECRLMGA